MTRIVSLLIALLAAAAAFAAPARAAPPRDTLVIGISQFPATFNPMIDPMLAKSYILGMVMRPFTAHDADWKNVCFLCTKLPTIENGLAKVIDLPNGKKGIAVTYTIHPKATWGDGTPVTTRDVIFAWKVGRHPKSGIANREPFIQTIRIEAKDAKTFTQVLDRVRFDYNALAPDPLPAHLEEEAFRAPAQYKEQTRYDRDPGNPGLYYGPYRIESIVSGSHVVLVRNKTWWGKTPHFDRIVVRVVSNIAALEANLLAGGVDYVAGELGLTLNQAVGLRERRRDEFRFIFKSGLIYEHADFNLDNPILADIRVRRALIHGIDRELMSAKMFRGLQPVAHTFVSPLDHISSKTVRRYEYDPKKAAALLKQAGWELDDDGFRYNETGDRLTLELMTTAGDRTRALVEEILQAYWRRIGVDIRIKNQPARVFFGRTVRQRRYTGLAMYAWLSSPESVPRTTLHSKFIPTEENNWSGQNNPGFQNAEMDGLIDRIQVELDPAKRKVMWDRMQAIYTEELPVLPLYFRASPFVIPKWLTGIRPTGHLVSTTLWIEHWGVAKQAAENR